MRHLGEAANADCQDKGDWARGARKMSVVKPYAPAQLAELHDRNRASAPNPISAEDLAEFLRRPELWRQGKPRAARMANGPKEWMQFVFQDMGLDCIVPPINPRLTDIQRESLRRFQLRLFFVPAIEEKQFPSSFVKPCFVYPNESRKPLPGKWVAVETIARPNWDDPEAYRCDWLAKEVLGLSSRFFVSWDDLHRGGLLAKIAEASGFSKKRVRLPTAEEFNFLGNLMNWLRANRNDDHLPDLGSTTSWEWTENAYNPNGCLVVGHCDHGRLMGAGGRVRSDRSDCIGFRFLAVL